jgi:pimeloyl-ACP methyl ester carboxylesterase
VQERVRVRVNGGVELEVARWHPPSGTEAGAEFLLVHGLASNLRLWDGVAAALAGRGYPVAAIDQRGHGRSDKPDDGYDFATVAGDVALVVEALGWDRPVVAGQSWGGNVVLEVAARHPSAVRGVACVDGGWIDFGARFPSWEACEAAMAPPQTEGLRFEDVEAGFHRRHPDWPESGIQGALACFEVRSDGTVAPWLSFDRHLRIVRAMWEQDVPGLYERVGEVPVLLLPCRAGDGSGQVETGWAAAKSSAVDAATAALGVSRTHWFTAEHDVHAQHPEQVADVLVAAVEDGFFS